MIKESDRQKILEVIKKSSDASEIYRANPLKQSLIIFTGTLRKRLRLSGRELLDGAAPRSGSSMIFLHSKIFTWCSK